MLVFPVDGFAFQLQGRGDFFSINGKGIWQQGEFFDGLILGQFF